MSNTSRSDTRRVDGTSIPVSSKAVMALLLITVPTEAAAQHAPQLGSTVAIASEEVSDVWLSPGGTWSGWRERR